MNAKRLDRLPNEIKLQILHSLVDIGCTFYPLILSCRGFLEVYTAYHEQLDEALLLKVVGEYLPICWHTYRFQTLSDPTTRSWVHLLSAPFQINQLKNSERRGLYRTHATVLGIKKRLFLIPDLYLSEEAIQQRKEWELRPIRNYQLAILQSIYSLVVCHHPLKLLDKRLPALFADMWKPNSLPGWRPIYWLIMKGIIQPFLKRVMIRHLPIAAIEALEDFFIAQNRYLPISRIARTCFRVNQGLECLYNLLGPHTYTEDVRKEKALFHVLRYDLFGMFAEYLEDGAIFAPADRRTNEAELNIWSESGLDLIHPIRVWEEY